VYTYTYIHTDRHTHIPGGIQGSKYTFTIHTYIHTDIPGGIQGSHSFEGIIPGLSIHLLLARLHVRLLSSNNDDAVNVCMYVCMCVGMYGEGIICCL
jgi:hypothetical protein